MKVSIDMGSTKTGQPALLDLEELLATRLLVQGNSGSGKSHLLRRLIEQSAQWVQQAIIDPEGDFVTLADRFGHVVVDAAEHAEPSLQQIAARVRQHRVSVVLNLEHLETERQMRHAAAFLGGLFDVDRDYWYPLLVVVDEAQLFAPTASGEFSEDARKASLGAMTNLMCRGRKRGLAGVIATQRLAKLAKNVAAEASNFLMGRTFLDIDMARAADLLGMDRRQAEMFRDLERGQFSALGPALTRRPLVINIGDVETMPRATSPKLMPPPATPPENARELIFTPGENEMPPPPPRRPTQAATADLLRQLSQITPETGGDDDGEDAADGAGRVDHGPFYDQVLQEVLSDPDAPFRSVAVLYQDFLVRCRGHGVSGRGLDLPGFRQRLAAARAGVSAQAMADNPQWSQVEAIAADLPEDLRPLYLLLARAAMEGAPCPSDQEIARARGSRSPRRARGLLEYMESRGLIQIRPAAWGKRSILLPTLEWETAPGDPGGEPAGDAKGGISAQRAADPLLMAAAAQGAAAAGDDGPSEEAAGAGGAVDADTSSAPAAEADDAVS